MVNQVDFDTATSLLSSIIATRAQHETVVWPEDLQVEGELLTEGWTVEDLKKLARAVTIKFSRGGQYPWQVFYEQGGFLAIDRVGL